MIQALAPYLGEDARIVNITSDAAVKVYAGWGGYGAGKEALEQIGNVLAAEKPEWRVYQIAPGGHAQAQ